MEVETDNKYSGHTVLINSTPYTLEYVTFDPIEKCYYYYVVEDEEPFCDADFNIEIL